MHTRTPIRHLIAAAAVFAAAGCAATHLPPGPEYPPGVRQAGTIDVQVFRMAQHLEMTNTTSTSYGPCRVWLNARYSRTIDGFASGQSIKVPLSGFVDEHGDVFKGGGFFATEKPERLVLTQIETIAPDGSWQMLGLVVVKGEDE